MIGPAWATLQRLRKFLEANGTRISIPDDRNFETEGEAIESGLRRTIEGRDTVMRSLVRAVYRFRDAGRLWQCAAESLSRTNQRQSRICWLLRIERPLPVRVGIRSPKSDDLKMSGIHTPCLSARSQRSTGERCYAQTPAVRIATLVVIADLFSNLSIRQPCRHRPAGPTGYDARRM